ncbi:FAD binding domain-containing protein [Streptomyces sp. H27-D2]|uniref:FAD binding domain-containing protein n=1 Tax=Streptomyces sp. H27-D2 TaxID=3046304 RepID=UPI002DB6906A|nr:xanthine dehydrogenase family protein subunit M [Streptomyces sp. H27-D2]MEC4016910.1 xanthine dehydrogenase family protein subunit M [Streptomyces sp. H27-D2]
MKDFSYVNAADTETALAALRTHGTQLLAGGTELLNWLKEGIEAPEQLVDITGLPLAGIAPGPHGQLRIGALARMSDVAAHPTVVREHPALAESLLLSASAQLRNMATIGGNLQQRTRCPYFRAETALPCNKRDPGSGCAALESGDTAEQAVFGWTPDCVATHPSDLAVALAALDATVLLRGPGGDRRVPADTFHLTPEQAPPERHTVLAVDELITGIELPGGGSGRLSHYLKLRRRSSYEFALVSAAAVVELTGGPRGAEIVSARIALGGVAHRPWRLTAAEEALRGLAADDLPALRAAVAASFTDARPLPDNAYKIELAQRAAVRALRNAVRRRPARPEAEGSPR